MQVVKLDHYSVIVQDIKVALDFYCQILGLSVDPSRPTMAYDGAWFNIGDSQIHLIELESVDPRDSRPKHVGRDRHIALRVKGIAELRQMLEQKNIAYTMSQSGRSAIFFRDPDGNGIECIEV